MLSTVWVLSAIHLLPAVYTAALAHAAGLYCTSAPPAAVPALQRVIAELVEGSTGTRQFPRAVQAVQALRQAAVEHSAPARFNQHLDQVRDTLPAAERA